MDVYFVYVTCAGTAEADTIASTVVGERLAACANRFGSIKSTYWWKGKVCDDEEVALILKTSGEKKQMLIERIKQLHSYDCPCVVCFPIRDGNPDFLEWITVETR